jgi:hypothetical protein
MRKNWKNRYKHFVDKSYSCDDCMDIPTCKRKERESLSGCEVYTTKEQYDEVNKTSRPDTIKRLAAEIGVTRQTIYNYLRSGLIKKPITSDAPLKILKIRKKNEEKKNSNLKQFKKK